MNVKNIDDCFNSWWPLIISFVITLIGSIRYYFGGARCPSENRIDGKVVLITGGSTGIGYETALELARKGATIILICRNEDKGRTAVEKIKAIVSNAKVVLKLLDMSKMNDIKKFPNMMKNEYNSIDVLINNAGVIFQQHELTEENLELTFATNYLGPFLLSHILLPLLKKSDNGRIINVTSLAHFSAKPELDNLNFCKRFIFREVYAQTKLYITMFTKYFGELLKGSKVSVYSVNPGIVRDTNHFRNSPLGSSWFTRISTYPWSWLFLKTPKQGCQTIVYAATESSLRNTTGLYLTNCEIKDPSEHVKNTNLLKELYDKSCDLCKIKSELNV